MSDQNEAAHGGPAPERSPAVAVTIVDNDESLYRRAGKVCIVPDGDGDRISSTAFNDRGFQPSVDRATMRKSPEETKQLPTDGVIAFPTVDVREIKDLEVLPAEDPPKHYLVDVLHRPIAEDAINQIAANPAHAQIEASPHPEADKRFRKVKERLALIANRYGWLIRPQ